MPRIALYARVSTTDQHPEIQIDALRAYAQARGFEVAGEFVDHGISGTRAKRPALDRMMADASRRRFDLIAVVKLDRLGRSLTHLLSLTGELEALGVDFISLEDGLDTSTPVGRFFFQVRGAFAEYERELIRERTRAGIAAAKRRGKTLGRPRVISEEASMRIRRLHHAGRSLRQIATLLGVSKTAVANEVERLGLQRAA
jgi:DNA invertase Pin-like site-specific DNA recombinase